MRPTQEVCDFFVEYRRQALLDTLQQRRSVYRTVSQQRAILKGEPADWFDPLGWRWRTFEDHPKHGELGRRAPKYRHVLNFYQYGWQVLQSAIQTAGIPGSIFTAQNSRQSLDRLAARLAKPIIDYERGVLDYQKIWAQIFRLFYTDGLVLSYVRHIPNPGLGQGVINKSVQAEANSPAGYQCDCGSFTQSGSTQRDDTGAIQCPQCSQPLHAQNFMPEMTVQHTQTQEVTVIKGKEVWDLYGALECPLPWWVSKLEDCPYVPIEVEVKKEQIISVFPDLEDEIEGSNGQEDIEAKRHRLAAVTPMRSITQPGFEGFRTYGRWWFRPETFWSERSLADGGLRDELLKTYPEGAFVQFADDVVLDAIAERAEDHVTLAWAFDMDGMYRPSLGQNGVPIHEAANTSFNQEIEAQEFADFPPILVDRGILTEGAIESSSAEPGTYKYIAVPPGKDLNNSVKQIVVNSTGQASNRLLDRAPKLMELLVGTAPALAGGQMVNARSAQQYETARAQALQRLATPYEAAKRLISDSEEMTVHEFLRNRTDQEIQEIVGEQFDKDQVGNMLAPRQGRIFAKPEQVESIPQTWAQKQAALNKLLTTQSPQMQEALADSNILQIIFDSMGLPELHVREKTLEDKAQTTIDQLSQAPPVPDPQSGMPGPSVAFEPMFDDPKIVIRVATEWAASPQGMESQRSNPNGFQNVKLYVQAAALAMAQAVDNSANPPVPGPQSVPQQQPAPAPQVSDTEMKEAAKSAVMVGLTKSKNPDQVGKLGVAVLEGEGILNGKAVTVPGE